jgi:hypothetical protein
MQFMPSEHQPPLPFIRLAEASDEMKVVGIESTKIANAVAVNADRTNFMINPSSMSKKYALNLS